MTPIALAIRFHLIAGLRSIISRLTWRGLLTLIMVCCVIAFGYSSYFVGVQRLATAPVSVIGTRLMLMASLAPFLFVEARRSAGRLAAFLSISGCRPATSLELVTLVMGGHLFFHAVIVIALIIPVVVRFHDAPWRAALHVAGDVTYVLVFRVLSVWIAVSRSAARRHAAGWQNALAAAALLLVLTVGPTVLSSRWEYADLTAIVLNVAVSLGFWHVVIDRMEPALIQEYLDGKALPGSDGARSYTRILPRLRVEAKIYLRCFLMTSHGTIYLLISAVGFGYLLIASILGEIPQEQRVATAIVLTWGATVASSSVLVDCFENVNLHFVRMTPVRFGRLTVASVMPLWIMLGCAAGGSAIPILLTDADVALVLVIASQVAFVPFAAWCSAMRFVGSTMLGGLQFTMIAVLTVILALVIPWLYGMVLGPAAVYLYRKAVRGYERALIEE